MPRCDDWQNWDQLSAQEKEQFLTDLVAETAAEFGIPPPNVEFADLDGNMGQYDAETNTVTIDPSAEGESGYPQFDDPGEAADTAFHETGHAAQHHYYDYAADSSYGNSPEGQAEADNVAEEQNNELQDECEPPPYPGDAGDGGAGDGLPTTVTGWEEAIEEQEELDRLLDELPLEPIPPRRPL